MLSHRIGCCCDGCAGIADKAQLGCSVNAVRGTTIARDKVHPGRLVVGTMLGLKLGLFADASVGIVLRTGTPDKAPLEEAAVAAALGIADGAQLGCSVNAVRGTTIARNKARPGRLVVVGTILGLKLRLFADASVGIVLITADGA
jgi:hypothetical protein